MQRGNVSCEVDRRSGLVSEDVERTGAYPKGHSVHGQVCFEHLSWASLAMELTVIQLVHVKRDAPESGIRDRKYHTNN